VSVNAVDDIRSRSIAFSASGRQSFQTVFDQFVEVFSDSTEVSMLIKRSTDFGGFIEELVHVIDK
jgi:lichenan operon transcriptional antiterminator